MKIDFIALSVPVFFILIFIELFYGYKTKQPLYRLNDTLTNLSCGIGQQVLGLWLKVYFLWLMFFFYEYRLFTVPNTWYYGILLFLGVDCCYYWFHRLSHEINAIWATHVVHHQSEEYNLSVALRQSWFQTLFSSAFYIPLPFLGFHPGTIGIIVALNTLYQFWIHTKAIKKMPKWFEFIFNTPSHHRVHHGTNPKYIDRNHAGSLIIWDKMFGTFQPEEEEVVYGITTPLRSWSPIWANFHYWVDITRVSAKARNFGDKVAAFVKTPGWYPKEMGGFQAPPEPDPAYEKYDTPVSKPLKIYLIVQYTLIVGITSYFMFFGKSIFDRQMDGQITQATLYRTIGIALFIIFSITSIGFLLQHKKFSWGLEMVRLITLGALGLLFISENYFYVSMAISGGLGLVSLLHFSSFTLFNKTTPIKVET